jgi:hypothetical protein
VAQYTHNSIGRYLHNIKLKVSTMTERIAGEGAKGLAAAYTMNINIGTAHGYDSAFVFVYRGEDIFAGVLVLMRLKNQAIRFVASEVARFLNKKDLFHLLARRIPQNSLAAKIRSGMKRSGLQFRIRNFWYKTFRQDYEGVVANVEHGNTRPFAGDVIRDASLKLTGVAEKIVRAAVVRLQNQTVPG